MGLTLVLCMPVTSDNHVISFGHMPVEYGDTNVMYVNSGEVKSKIGINRPSLQFLKLRISLLSGHFKQYFALHCLLIKKFCDSKLPKKFHNLNDAHWLHSNWANRLRQSGFPEGVN